MFLQCKKRLLSLMLMPVCLVSLNAFCFKVFPVIRLQWLQTCLSHHFNADSEPVKLKKWDFNVTESGFFRFRKYQLNGKQEYFSFHLNRLAGISYLGSVNYGTLIVRTRNDDIIVQTFNDPRGNVDSMARELRIPLSNMEPETLDSLVRFISIASGE